jgi:hypothetical protein
MHLNSNENMDNIHTQNLLLFKNYAANKLNNRAKENTPYEH